MRVRAVSARGIEIEATGIRLAYRARDGAARHRPARGRRRTGLPGGAQRRREDEPPSLPDRARAPDRRARPSRRRAGGRVDRSTLARLVAVVPGQVELPFSMRVEDVVALGRIPHEHPLRRARARTIGRPSMAPSPGPASSTCGAATPASCRWASVSSCSSAIALAQGGRLIVLDEPTVHLDLRHQVAVLSLLTRPGGAGRDRRSSRSSTTSRWRRSSSSGWCCSMTEPVVADGPPAEVLTPERILGVYGVHPRFVPALG